MTKDEMLEEIKKQRQKYKDAMEELDELIIRVHNEASTESGIWKPKLGDGYYYMDSMHDIGRYHKYSNDSVDKKLMEIGNYFKTKEEAKATAIKVGDYMRLLKSSSIYELMQWHNRGYIIAFNKTVGLHSVEDHSNKNYLFKFMREEDCKKFLSENSDDIMTLYDIK